MKIKLYTNLNIEAALYLCSAWSTIKSDEKMLTFLRERYCGKFSVQRKIMEKNMK